MSVLRYIRLDVFSNQLFTGIQLGVFPDAAELTSGGCVAIAGRSRVSSLAFQAKSRIRPVKR